MRHKLSADIFKTVVASEQFDHLDAKDTNSGSVSKDLDGCKKPVSPKAEDPHVKFAGFYEDYLQDAMNLIHKDWQQQGLSMEEMLAKLPSDAHKTLFALAKLHYQVQNGGFSQWISNGYAGNGQGDLLLRELPGSGEATLVKIFDILQDVEQALIQEAENNGVEFNGFDDAEEVYNSGSNKDLWQKFCDDNSYEVSRIESNLPGFNLETHEMSLDIDTDNLPLEVVKNLPLDLEDTSDCDSWQNFLDENEDSEILNWLDWDEETLSNFRQGLSDLYEFLESYNRYESKGGESELEEVLDACDTQYYKATEDQEEYFKQVAHFLETMEPNVASLKKAFKLGSLVAPTGSRPFRVIAAAQTTDDIKIQARFLDGSVEILNKKVLASLSSNLGSTLRRLSNLMITSYNKDFDLYVKTAIKDAGLPVDDEMNWSSYLERIYKNVVADQELRDEVAHHMIIEHLYRLKTLLKFDPAKAPDKDNPLAKQVTTFLKKMFSYSVSKAREWVAAHYGYGKVVKKQEIDPETGETVTKTELKDQEVQPEFGTGEETYNIFDTKPTFDDYGDLESSSDLKEFKREFFPWLNRVMGKKVGPNLAILFDATLNNEDSEDVWKEFESKTQKSFSYYKKAIVNLRENIKRFIEEGHVDKSNLLVRLVNDYTKKLVGMEDTKKVTSSVDPDNGHPSGEYKGKNYDSIWCSHNNTGGTSVYGKADGKITTLKTFPRGVNSWKDAESFVNSLTTKNEENKMSRLGDIIAKKKEAAQKESAKKRAEARAKKALEIKKPVAEEEKKEESKEASKKKASLKYATLRRIAEEEPEALGEAIAELRDKFMDQVEALDALAENLNLTPEDLEGGSEVETEEEFKFPEGVEASKKASKFASGLRHVADEEPEEVEISLNEIYSNIDLLAEGVENLADNLGVELEENPEEEISEEKHEEEEVEQLPE